MKITDEELDTLNSKKITLQQKVDSITKSNPSADFEVL